MVEVTGLEPAASWSQTKHSTKLSYTSLLTICTVYSIAVRLIAITIKRRLTCFRVIEQPYHYIESDCICQVILKNKINF